jgi:transcriptional regulator with XRE-family HTH domain
MRTFFDIDRLRAEHGLTRKAVIKKAGVNFETWRRTSLGRTTPNLRTLEKLSDAVDQLIAEKEAAE